MLVLATIGLLFVGLLAVAGFAVMAQRRLRSLGMLSSLGATDRHVRIITLANGAAVGVTSAAVGAAVGLAGWVAFRLSGQGILLWMGPIWILLVIPVLDALIGVDTSNPPEWATEQLEQDDSSAVAQSLHEIDGVDASELVELQLDAFHWANEIARDQAAVPAH